MGPIPDIQRISQSSEHWTVLRAACEGDSTYASGALPTGWGVVDRALPRQGLATGKVHEWLGISYEAEEDKAHRRTWLPPLSILAHLARQAGMSQREKHGGTGVRGRAGAGLLVWVGEAVWPFPATLADDAAAPFLSRSIFVRAACPGARLWATDLALRSAGAAAVIADGSRFDLSATRRLQLAAEAGGGLCFLARPPWERAELSAAATRWRVRFAPPVPAAYPFIHTPTRRWTVELLRCKGVQPTAASSRCWILEHDRATRHGLVVAELLDRPGETTAAPRLRTG